MYFLLKFLLSTTLLDFHKHQKTTRDSCCKGGGDEKFSSLILLDISPRILFSSSKALFLWSQISHISLENFRLFPTPQKS